MTFTCVTVPTKEPTQKIQSWNLTLKNIVYDLLQWNSFTNDETCFLFRVYTLVLLEMFTFLSWTFGYVEKRLDRNAKTNFPIYDVTDWTVNNCNRDNVQYPEAAMQTELFLKKGALKICTKFTGEHPCRNVISTN